MIDIINTLINEPNKKWKVILEFFKIIISISIVHYFIHLDFTSLNLNSLDKSYLADLLWGTIFFLLIYFLIWPVVEYLVSQPILSFKTKGGNKKTIKDTLIPIIIESLQIIKIEDSVYLPGKNYLLIPHIIDLIDKRNYNSVSDTLIFKLFFSSIITTLIIFYGYGISYSYWGIAIICFLFLAYILNRFEKLLNYAKKKSFNINQELYLIEFRSIVIDALEDYNCKINDQKNGLCITVNNKIFQIIDLGIYLPNVGIHAIEEVIETVVKNLVPDNTIFITNATLKDDTRSFLLGKGIVKIIESSDEYQIFEEITSFSIQERKKLSISDDADK